MDTVDLADTSGWKIDSTQETDLFTKRGTTIEVRYAANDEIDSAVKREPHGEVKAVSRGDADKVEVLRSWLTGVRTVGLTPATAPSELYWEFWKQFRNRVAVEHPDWKARAGTSRTAPNATLPEGTPRAFFCSAFKPGPLRLELAFNHPEPAVNLARFNALRLQRAQFEQAVGDSVVWDEMAGRNDTRLYVESPFQSVDQRDKWPAMMDWLIDHHIRFKKAIEAVGGING